MRSFFNILLVVAFSFGTIASYEQTADTLCHSSTTVPFSTNQQNLTVWNGSSYSPIFLKGVNLGVAVPGTYPGELAATRADYGRWLHQIRETGFNVIRIYTLHFPRFYEVLDSFNLAHPQDPLLLIQGIWLSEGFTGYQDDLFSLSETFTNQIEEVVDCTHGNRVIDPRPGEAHGTYLTDVSPWVLAYIIGREVHPPEILTTNELHPGFTSFSGQALSISNGTPSETWITEQLNHLVMHERQNYQVERPVSFSSWPTLDPIDHPTETGYEDSASVDLTKIDFSKAPGGLFASYHAYPYYPDFVSEDPGYQTYSDYLGPNSYVGYLSDLKTHYTGIPLIIAEYGTPSSWGTAHYSQSGMNHGGFSEKEQGQNYIRMLHNIEETGCGGGVSFAWIDEWFKRTWITEPLENDRRVLWHNVTGAEQNFGLIGFHKTPVAYQPWGTFASGCGITKIDVNSDFEYFRLRIGLLGPLADLDTIWVSFDTYNSALGESILPDGNQVTNRAEFALRITNYSADLYVTRAYDLFGIWHGTSTPDQLFHSIPTNGAPWDLVRWKNNDSNYEIQYIGNMLVRRIEMPSSTREAVVISDTTLDLRIPWTLLQFIDPSSLTVINDDRSTPEREDTVSDGISVTVFHNGCSATPPNRFLWNSWNFPTGFAEYEKGSLAILREELPFFAVPPIALCDEYSVNKNNTLYISESGGVLQNDYDPDGDLLEAEPYTFTAHGTLYFYADGSFDYVPEPGYAGPDEFSYRAFDGFAHSLSTPVYIHVENNEAILANDAGQFNLYPNPASEWVTALFPSYAPGSLLTVYTVNGIEVFSQVIEAETTKMDVSGLKAGIYAVRVTSDQNAITRKLCVY
ncbi:MAG: T9SS type A sorting domain-containing protein [Bacteroidales bacterium]|nr:T9SS type A sorting domain-containing protein [Bacteroidales bacterium]